MAKKDCNHNNLTHKEIKKVKKEILDCNNENCNFHVEKMLPSVLIMGINYIFSGIIISLVCFLPLIYINNYYFRILSFIPLTAFGLWGFIVLGAGIYICILCLFDQHIITHKNGTRYRHIELKKFESKKAR